MILAKMVVIVYKVKTDKVTPVNVLVDSLILHVAQVMRITYGIHISFHGNSSSH